MRASTFCVSTTGIVSAVTAKTQAGLLTGRYCAVVDAPNLTTAAGRIRRAIKLSGKTLTELALEVGCSHAALSQWQSGRTDIAGIKAGLLQKFAEATNTDVRWLLTGQGPVVSRYMRTAELERVATALRVMERTAPLQIETVVRMVEAAATEAAPHH